MVDQAAQSIDLPSHYEPAQVEPGWAERWAERGYFQAHVPTAKPPFCIVIPPPNVTGRLHVGHAIGRTLEDTLVRRARMRGFETLWLPGTDHAGIATQIVVERALAEDGVDRHALGREAFVERVWQWREQYGGEILEQMRRMGASLDWDRLRFTMDDGLSHAVRVAFVRMYEDGLIYRSERLVNWCPRDRTGLSDSEVQFEDVEGELVTFGYPLSDGTGSIDVATTRVETMLGDTGIAVHPDDDRHRALVGSTVRHPLDGRDLPIVADAAVDPAFGTGAVKVTPAHDPTDFEIGARHGLELRNILKADASLNDEVPPEFRGLDRYEARRVVGERLRELGLLVRAERPYRHPVGHCYRCHAEIEPWISGLQWFVAVDRLKHPARQAALDGRIRFWPGRWLKPYTDWLENLRDWNISRQLWWGHRIPAWYCPDGHITVAVEDPADCATCGATDLVQDEDVLDTWFSSQLWPFSTLGWPDATPELELFYPNTALVTGYEILYLWVARMVMAGLYLVGDVPFRDVVIHGLVRDVQGRKMSKSLGNVIDPIEIIDRYGADALRFALARAATGSQQDIPLSEESIAGGRHFANKIWNAARLVLRAHRDAVPQRPPEDRLTLAERWLLSRAQACLADVDASLDDYRFSDATQALYRFLWSEFCDWGLEMEKGRLDGDDAERGDAAGVLAWVLERTLRALHPVMPFVTEEIWQHFDAGESIAIAAWPQQMPDHADADAERSFGVVQDVVTALRQFRARHAIPPSRRFEARAAVAGDDAKAVEALAERVVRLAGLSSLAVAGRDATAPQGWTRVALPSGGAVAVPPGLFDASAERARLDAERADASRVLERSRGKLGNDGFLTKAAPDVVAAERDRAAQAERRLGDIDAQLSELDD
jgi:valyl-tRNA synthetase